MNTILKVAKKEYLKIVQKPSFWIMIVIVPILYLALAGISGYSGTQVEKKVEEEVKNIDNVLIVDQSGIVNEAAIQPPYFVATGVEEAEAQVKTGNADAAFIYPENVLEDKVIEIYALDTSLISRDRFNNVAKEMIRQSILLEIEDPERVALFSSNIELKKTLYKDGEEVDQRFEVFIIPIISILVYFLLVMFSSSFMLSSVSEEKENRMIETILSIVKPRQLIWGKLVGLTGVSLTALIALLALMTGIVIASTNIFPITIDWSAVDVTFGQVLLSVFYTIGGFLFLSSIMVGVGAAMPKYREAQQFSTIFIMLSILPIYFATILIAEPAGSIAKIVSYTPFTAPLILLFRSSVDALSPLESILGIVAVSAYVLIGFFFAFKLFELGSLEVNKKISFKALFQKQKDK
ncbi:ABC transporter permease [Patescibacteria group bacterium]|nr:ABC transporter permease [Patescibacteria group bacterium]MBU1075285.1 ABC transporter permease [Patescibacteria group bacterium]MBU1952435.1 ABC transporter permease [Patescibacteria group bacterium]